MSKQPNEHRKHIRVYRNFILSYYPVSDPTKQKNVSQINNVSQGGLNFSVSELIEPGQVLGIELRTPFLADHVYLEGQVLECKEKISDLIYEVRIKFSDLPAATQEVLAKIEQYAHKES